MTGVALRVDGHQGKSSQSDFPLNSVPRVAFQRESGGVAPYSRLAKYLKPTRGELLPQSGALGPVSRMEPPATLLESFRIQPFLFLGYQGGSGRFGFPSDLPILEWGKGFSSCPRRWTCPNGFSRPLVSRLSRSAAYLSCRHLCSSSASCSSPRAPLARFAA